MSIKRYIANKDNTITNAYGLARNERSRATGSNMGAADILETFSIYGQNTTSSAELSRILIQFPIDTISSDRTAGTIPASGSAKFFLKMSNARHSEQLPRDFTLSVQAVSQSWQEGYGLDMDTYTDKTKDSIDGSNWIMREKGVTWGKVGGDYHSSSYSAGATMPNYTYTFSEGTEDMDLDVTAAVEEWIAGTQTNNGFGVFLSPGYEAYTTASDGSILLNTSGQRTSFYTKRFFSRTSEYFFRRPYIEARWDSRVTDDRGNFYYSSSLAPAVDNLNTIYLYNYVRGQLRNVPEIGTGKIYVSIYSGSAKNTVPGTEKLALSLGGDVVAAGHFNVTGGYVSTGIYSASFAFTGSSTLKTIYDVWHNYESTIEYTTGSIVPKTLNSPGWDQYQQYATKITNLKPSYNKDEQARLRVAIRPRNYNPTIYNVASSEMEITTVPSASYEVIRMADNSTIVNNSTGSATRHTYLSYDNSGSYFDFDMSILQPGYMYGFKFAYHVSNNWREQERVHKFRVEDN